MNNSFNQRVPQPSTLNPQPKFYSSKTVFDPDYRNVQAELWTLLSNDQQMIVGSSFAHLKNHAQIEIAEALIDFIETGILPDNDSWQNHVTGGIFQFILVKAFPEKVAELINEKQKTSKSTFMSNFLKGFRK